MENRTFSMLKQAVNVITGQDDNVQNSDISSTKSVDLTEDIVGSLLLDALDGFLFVVNCQGTVRFVSENVTQYLGYTPDDLMDKSVYNVLYVSDHSTFGNELQNLQNALGSGTHRDRTSRTFSCRMNVKNPTESKTYEHMQISGVQQLFPSKNDGGIDGESKLCLVCLARRVPLADHEQIGLVDKFVTKQDLNGVIIYCDVEALGKGHFSSSDFVGRKLSDLCHSTDQHMVHKHLQEVVERQKEHHLSGVYRFHLPKYKYVFVQTRSRLEPTATSEECIRSVHNIVRECDSEAELKGTASTSLMKSVMRSDPGAAKALSIHPLGGGTVVLPAPTTTMIPAWQTQQQQWAIPGGEPQGFFRTESMDDTWMMQPTANRNSLTALPPINLFSMEAEHFQPMTSSTPHLPQPLPVVHQAAVPPTQLVKPVDILTTISTQLKPGPKTSVTAVAVSPPKTQIGHTETAEADSNTSPKTEPADLKPSKSGLLINLLNEAKSEAPALNLLDRLKSSESESPTSTTTPDDIKDKAPSTKTSIGSRDDSLDQINASELFPDSEGLIGNLHTVLNEASFQQNDIQELLNLTGLLSEEGGTPSAQQSVKQSDEEQQIKRIQQQLMIDSDREQQKQEQAMLEETFRHQQLYSLRMKHAATKQRQLQTPQQTFIPPFSENLADLMNNGVPPNRTLQPSQFSPVPDNPVGTINVIAPTSIEERLGMAASALKRRQQFTTGVLPKAIRLQSQQQPAYQIPMRQQGIPPQMAAMMTPQQQRRMQQQIDQQHMLIQQQQMTSPMSQPAVSPFQGAITPQSPLETMYQPQMSPMVGQPQMIVTPQQQPQQVLVPAQQQSPIVSPNLQPSPVNRKPQQHLLMTTNASQHPESSTLQQLQQSSSMYGNKSLLTKYIAANTIGGSTESLLSSQVEMLTNKPTNGIGLLVKQGLRAKCTRGHKQQQSIQQMHHLPTVPQSSELPPDIMQQLDELHTEKMLKESATSVVDSRQEAKSRISRMKAISETGPDKGSTAANYFLNQLQKKETTNPVQLNVGASATSVSVVPSVSRQNSAQPCPTDTQKPRKNSILQQLLSSDTDAVSESCCT